MKLSTCISNDITRIEVLEILNSEQLLEKRFKKFCDNKKLSLNLFKNDLLMHPLVIHELETTANINPEKKSDVNDKVKYIEIDQSIKAKNPRWKFINNAKNSTAVTYRILFLESLLIVEEFFRMENENPKGTSFLSKDLQLIEALNCITHNLISENNIIKNYENELRELKISPKKIQILFKKIYEDLILKQELAKELFTRDLIEDKFIFPWKKKFESKFVAFFSRKMRKFTDKNYSKTSIKLIEVLILEWNPSAAEFSLNELIKSYLK
jgi:hypothetical protein